MGSGETAPTMVKPHRGIFDRIGDRPAMLLDTPYGFQENADDISAKAVGYFAASVGRRVEVLGWRGPPAPGLPLERALARLDDAGWLFAGPGSPTYALRQWRDTPLPEALSGVLARDGVVVFASAAALTLGSHTVPVYEIYKAGATPYWERGLDLVRAVSGLPAVVVPHYDNAEGGHHDTRFCYLGERRLSILEHELPDEAFVLGVDEHTAVLLDLAEASATVVGNGCLTVRRRGVGRTYRAGSAISFAELMNGPSGAVRAAAGSPVATREGAVEAEGSTVAVARSTIAAPGRVGATPDRAGDSQGDGDPAPPTSLRAAADGQLGRFDAALAARDVDSCVAATLDLEQALHDWSADTQQSDATDHARATLRRMVVRLGELAVDGARDPRETVGPHIEALLELRRRARDGRDYPTSDWIRDRLTGAGVEIRDTPDGATWALEAR